MTGNGIGIVELERLLVADAPDRVAAVLALIASDDPAPTAPLAEGALDLAGFRSRLALATRTRDLDARITAIRELWQRFLAQAEPPPPPRLLLAEILAAIYDAGDEAGRAAILELVATARLRWGLWGGLKRIFKRAEERLDAEMYGALTARFDVTAARYQAGQHEVSRATLVYLRKRAWRFLRHLGVAMPTVYPGFVVEALRHYPADAPVNGCWILQHVTRHASRAYHGNHFYSPIPTDLLADRAFPDAWKIAPEPLLRLLETAVADLPARFAVQALTADFPTALNHLDAPTLLRLIARPVGAVHELVVARLKASPDLAPARLRTLALHEPALTLLASPSPVARAWAVEYVRGHATDLDAERLVELVNSPHAEVSTMAAALLALRSPRDLGFELLGRLIGTAAGTWAEKALLEVYAPRELPAAFYLELLFGKPRQLAWTVEALDRPDRAPPPGFWTAVLDDPRALTSYHPRRVAIERLGRHKAADIGAAWLLDAAVRFEPRSDINQLVNRILLAAETLPGLDVEQVKGFMFQRALRPLAMGLLQRRSLVRFEDIGLPWLLALARRTDRELHDWASRYLLQHLGPEDFADASGAADRAAAGIARLFELATGEREPESVRAFAQTYLRCHHPLLGPNQPEARSYQLTPRIPRDAYTAARVEPFLVDPRLDVRRWAAPIAGVELRRWGHLGRLFALADAAYPEPRALAIGKLVAAGSAASTDADASVPTADELDPGGIYAMTESRYRVTRETAMDLIERFYDRLGGAERLAWLMASGDRTVRTMAVRLLWQRHRPRSLPPEWKPRKPIASAATGPTEPFADVEALRRFLRQVLFGLPPGRSPEPRDRGAPVRRLAASVAKRWLIETARDLALEDEAFARTVAPVLLEMTGSIATGEWQAALAALAQLQAAHPSAGLEAPILTPHTSAHTPDAAPSGDAGGAA